MTDNKFETLDASQTMSEEELLARIAWFYYHDNLTQGEIGDKLGLPRLKVSRLLEKDDNKALLKSRLTHVLPVALN